MSGVITATNLQTSNIKSATGNAAITIADNGNTTIGGTATFSSNPSGITTTTLGTAVTTSGAAEYGFTGIPSTVKHIKFYGVSVSRGTGSGMLVIQLGDSGGYETTGYTYQATYGWGNSAALYHNAPTDNLGAAVAIYDEVVNFFADIVKVDGNQWLISGQGINSAAAGDGVKHSNWFGVSKTLSGTLDRVRIIDTNSTNLDGGKINIIYG